MINFEAIKDEFIEKFGDTPGIVSIDLKQNLIRVMLVDDSVLSDQSLPGSFTHIPQNYDIGIEYDSLARVEARKKFKEEQENIKALLEDVKQEI